MAETPTSSASQGASASGSTADAKQAQQRAVLKLHLPDARICSGCSKHPCLGIRRQLSTSWLPEIVLLTNSSNVPTNCPARVSRMPREIMERMVSRLTHEEAARALSRISMHATSPSSWGQRAHATHAELMRALIKAGHTALWAAPGSHIDFSVKRMQAAIQVKAKAKPKKAMAEDSNELLAEKEKPKPALTATSWVWLENPKRPDCEEKTLGEASLLDTVWCKVDTQGLMPGDSITFSLFLKGREGKEDIRITTESGRVGEGRSDQAGVARYVIPDSVKSQALKPKLDKLYFIAKQSTHGLEVKSPELILTPRPVEFWLEVDVDDPAAKDDVLILQDEGGSEVERVEVVSLKEEMPDHVLLKFKNWKEGGKYSLIRDHGSDDDGGQDWIFKNMSLKEIQALFPTEG